MKHKPLFYMIFLTSLGICYYLYNDSNSHAKNIISPSYETLSKTDKKETQTKPTRVVTENKEDKIEPTNQIDIIKEPTSIANKSSLPKNMKDVKISNKLQKSLDEYPDSYEKIDYKLRFYDKLFTCLGTETPTSGKIITHLYFTIDESRTVATGSDGSETGNLEAFQIRNSTITREQEDRVLLCARESHIGQEMDISNSTYPQQIKDFYKPTDIFFPQEENEIYWFLSHDGEYKNGAKE